MTRKLDLPDIQGNIVFAYKLPYARYFFFEIKRPNAGREFINALRREVTTAEDWAPVTREKYESPFVKPPCTMNVSISWWGLVMLGLPTRTLRDMPTEFINGMYKRRHIVGDALQGEGKEAIKNWDFIWRAAVARKTQYEPAPDDAESDVTPDDDPNYNRVHILVSVYANFDLEALKSGQGYRHAPELDKKTAWLKELCSKMNGGVQLLKGHGPDRAEYQQASLLFVDGQPAAKEHFAFTDGIGDPTYEGQWAHAPDENRLRRIGRGKLLPANQRNSNDDGWRDLATGEFILGHADESQELPECPRPATLMRNGTFLVYRKLHQNAKAFNDYIKTQAEIYVKTMNLTHSRAMEEATDTLRAKMVGRWPDGMPLIKVPTWEKWQETKQYWAERDQDKDYAYKKSPENPRGYHNSPDYKKLINDFGYAADEHGHACPLGAHIRRANTRDMLDPRSNLKKNPGIASSALNKRRRILRRGLPYGDYAPDAPDSAERGVVFIALCASIFRQFEFVQQQWINFGMDFEAGNDTCPVIGRRGTQEHTGSTPVKFVVPSTKESGNPPFVCANIPEFVETRGGDYFFIPSVTALRMIAAGTVDPT